MTTNVLALFDFEDTFLNAARKLKAAGFNDLTLMSPIPLHDADEVLGLGKSAVRRFSLIGALTGAVAGFSMAAGTAMVFLLPTGGRPIITIPPYLVITYEMTILFGVLATLLGFHFVSGLPAWRDAPYRMESNVDQFSLLVGVEPDADLNLAESIMRDAGAAEVSRWRPNHD